MSTRIKICGLRDAETISRMDGLPIHEIGFVLAPSKRRVDKSELPVLAQAARRLKAAGDQPPLTVGVFVNAALDEMDDIIGTAALDIVQLHGDESPDYCERIKEKHPAVRIWRVFSIRDMEIEANETLVRQARERLAPYAGVADAILIDAPGGGTGQPFNWSAIGAYKQEAGALGLPLYVAGGLHSDNVQELLQAYSPDGIDVSSGVETDGRKDVDKIRLFVRKVMEA